MGFVLDAYPLIALLLDEAAAAEVDAVLRRGDIRMNAINLAEAIDVVERRNGVRRSDLEHALAPLFQGGIHVVPITEGDAWRAAALRRAHYRRRTAEVSLADCFLVATADSDDVVVTADPPVAAMARAEDVGVHGVPDSTGRKPQTR